MAQEVELGAVVHGAFQRPEAIDPAFGLPAAPGQVEAGADGGPILPEAGGEARDHPPAAAATAHDPAEPASEVDDPQPPPHPEVPVRPPPPRGRVRPDRAAGATTAASARAAGVTPGRPSEQRATSGNTRP